MEMQIEVIEESFSQYVDFDPNHWNSSEGAVRFGNLWVFYLKHQHTIEIEVFDPRTNQSMPKVTLDRADLVLV